MSAPNGPLGRHVAPALDEARLERQRAAVAARVQPRGGRTSALAGAAVGLSCVLAIAALVARRERPAPAPGTVIETAAGGETITLPEGSRVQLEAQSRLTLAEARAESVRLELERGGVTLDVVPSSRRPFVVVAEGYEARVLGTRFSVRLDEGGGRARSIEVEVTRGRVRVARVGDDGDVRTLGAGERWSAPLGGPPSDAA
ncbi:MAG TPA: FecR family protein, partial [Polyangia bacterium]|nr:FecR family protein [Polyangia bacterium]